MNPTKSSELSLQRAQEMGRRDAEHFVLRLEAIEQREREERLAVMAWQPRGGVEVPWNEEKSSAEVLRLEARVQELSSYQQAVENSAPWRAIQWVRRLFGRAW